MEGLRTNRKGERGIGMRRLGRVAVAMLVGWGLVGAPVLATTEEYEGYCEDGVPVVISWPEKYKNFEPECDGDRLDAINREPIPGRPGIDRERPPDLDHWATVWLNGYRVVNPYEDAWPYVVQSSGRTLIPIRVVTEAMGGEATWNDMTREVTIQLGDKYMIMTIDSPRAMANGEAVLLDQPPLIWNGRTMVPLRVLAEAFGATVAWVKDGARVEVSLPGVVCRERYCHPGW